MTSLRHALVTGVVSTTMQRSVAASDADAARRIVAARPRRPARPPRRVQRSVHVRTTTTAGFPVHTVTPRGGADGPTVLYLHGGAYVADLVSAHWSFARRLVDHLGATVVLPRYPLAPEATWRTSFAALRSMALGVEGRAPVLMGDSAGGGLALALAASLGPAAHDVPALVLISPWVDLLVDQPPGEIAACRDPWLDAESLRQCGRLWAGDDDPARPELSPLRADLAGVPPTMVLTGTRDVLHPQALRVVDALRAARVPTRLQTGTDLIHVYPLLPVPEADLAFEQVVSFVRHPAGTTR